MSENKFTIKSFEKLPDSEAQIVGEISLEFLKKLRKEALANLNKAYSLPGFRAGHIPEDVLVKNVGEMKVIEECAELALGREYSNIILETKLNVIGRPDIAITKMAPEVPLEFQIRVPLEPEFDLPDYKSIAKVTAEEKDVEKRRIKIVEALTKATEMTLPKSLVEKEVHHMLHHFKTDVEKAGIKWENYLEKVTKTEEDIKNDWRKGVVDRIKAEIILFKIAKVENLESYQKVFEFLESLT